MTTLRRVSRIRLDRGGRGSRAVLGVSACITDFMNSCVMISYSETDIKSQEREALAIVRLMFFIGRKVDVRTNVELVNRRA